MTADMHRVPSMPSEVLRTSGIAAIPGVWSSGSVDALNTALDDPFRTRSGERRAYVSAYELAELGVLEHVFPGGARALIAALVSDPVLYHCHAYEISGSETRPHIHGSLLAGWHRDTETLAAYDPAVTRFVSIFVYLSDVGPANGPFELVDRDPELGFAPGLPCVSMTGPAGLAFAWNRSFYHRAAPNRSPERRRLLKLSVQPRSLPNDRITQPELTRAAAHHAVAALGLGSLFGSPSAAPDIEAPPAGPIPAIARVAAHSGAVVSRRAVAAHRLVSLARPSVR